MIRMGEGAQGPLRSIVQSVTGVVDGFAELPAPVQQSVTVLAAVSGAALTAAGGAMVLIPRIVETKRAMDELNISAASLSSGMRNALTSTSRLAGLGRSLSMVGLIAGITAATGGTDKFKESADSAAISLQQLAITGRSAGSAFQSLDMTNVTAADFTDTLHDIAGGMSAAEKGATMFASTMDAIAGVVGADTRSDFQKTKDELESMGQALASMDTSQATDAFKQLGDMTDGSEKALSNLLTAMPAYKEHLKSLATEAGIAADDATLLAIASGELDIASTGAGSAAASASGDINGMGDSADDASQSISDVTESLKELYGVVLSERDAQRSFEQALDDVTASIEENGTSLDITTEAGRANQEALDNVASSALDLADSMAQAGASQGDIQAKMTDMRAAFIGAAGQFGITGEAAEALADQLGLIPEDIAIEATADTSQAQTALDEFAVSVDSFTGTLDINGQTFPAEQSLSSLLSTIDASQGTTTVNGETMPASEALAAYVGLVNNSDGTVSINGDPTNGRYKLDELVLTADSSTGTISVGAKDNASGAVRTIIAGLPSSHTITVTTNWVENHTINTFRNEAPVQRLINGHATGGAISGPGTGTSDSILARLSNGEHVWTAAEVAAVGGQSRMVQLRALARAGMLSRNVLGFADGGSPSFRAEVPAVHVSTVNQAPTANVTVVVDNPISGEQIRSVARSVADGQIVKFTRMER